jgi:D-alanyl-lipoteichoic acid acyltransferase DltB (MBOAT superfamily)
MLFNSIEYFIFLPFVILGYFLLPFRFRNYFLLVVSYYFYMRWKWEFGFLILVISLVNYAIGLKISYCINDRSRKLWLSVAVIISMGVLVYYKYANFFLHETFSFLSKFEIDVNPVYLNVILPVGISFFTFQALSYTIDVYKKSMRAEKDPFTFLLYVSFFPQLVAGPIERATNLLDQFRTEKHFSSDRLIQGSKLIIWGLFKKVVIADRLAIYVQQIYSDPKSFEGGTLLLATFFFAFQIYCDFSGYSDIAIGSAHILGFKLMTNFNLPYFAASIKEFWHRWHISLSTWFGDYVYKPLGGNRVKTGRWIINILTVYLVSGLWHGANLTFIAWGAIFGLLYIIEHNIGKILVKTGFQEIVSRSKIIYVLRIMIVFSGVMVAWVFFRANNISDAAYIITHFFSGLHHMPYLGSSAFETTLGLFFIIVLYVIEFINYKNSGSFDIAASMPVTLRWATYVSLVMIILLLGISSMQFIYFQF